MRISSSALTLLVLAGCTGHEGGITKFNNDPEATITSHSDGDVVDEGYVVTLRGTIADTNDDPADLVATWYSGADELCGTAPVESDGTTLCEAVLGVDDTEIVLEGQDDDNASGTARVTLVVNATDAPTAEITAPDAGGTFYSDVPVVVEALVADAEDAVGDLVVAWTDEAGAEVALDTIPDGDGLLSDTLLLDEGDHTLVLTVTDTTGKTGTASVEITVGAANTPPSCAIREPEEGASAGLDATVTFTGTVSDIDQAANLLAVTWESDVDGLLASGTPEVDGSTTFDTDTLSYGTHVITLTGTDEAGATCADTVTFSIGAPPTVVIDTPIDGDLYNEGDVVSFVATVADDGSTPDVLSIAWESDVDGLLDVTPADASGLAGFATDALSPGEHVVTLTATDLDGLWTEATVTLTVNGLPGAPDLAITPAAPSTDDDLVATVTADAVDPEGDAVTYSYAWTVDGVATAYATDTVPASATTRGEVWAVTVTPDDGWGAGSPATASVTVGNSAPALADVTLSPDPAWEGTPLTCSPGVATDADGDAVAYSYAWTVNGLAIPATGSQLDDTWWGRGDAVACVVTPDDGAASGVAVTSNVVTVDNSAPSITAVSVTPADPTAADTLTCAASGFADADGDADQTLYEWTIDGVVVGTGDTFAGGFGGGDEVVCTATPYDGALSGTARSASVVVANTPPVLASVSLTPSAPTEADTLTCAPGPVTDADGTTSFSYTYSWTIGGAVIGETGATLDGGDFEAGDTVRCRVVPNDGTDDGAMVASATVTVANTPPVATAVTLSPTSPDTDDTLTATPSGTDLDGDTLTWTYTWYVEGAVVPATGATLDGGWFSRGDEVYVAVAPYDGTDAGAAIVSSAVIVGNSAPSIAAATITPETAYVTSTLTCAASGWADADGDADLTTFAWTVNGAAAGSGSTLSGGFSAGDVVACTATPDDGTDTGTSRSDSVTIANTAPTLASATLAPTAAYEASTLTCTPGSATDADGTTSFTYTYAWTVDGASIAATSATLTGASFGRGDDVRCTVTASDGSASSAAVASNTVTIGNTAPVVSAVSISPTSPTTSSTLTASVTAADADGDTISHTYAWYVNGAAVAATGSTLSSAYFGGSDTVYVRVTPTDGTDTGTAVSSSTVTIANTAPVMSSVSLTPTTAYEASTLTCAGSGSDADGDTLSYGYTWYVNSAAIAPTSATLSGTYFGKGDTVQCAVTPNDGTTSGTALSSNAVVISNTAPTVASASLTPTTAYEASTLTCTPASGADVDGDTVSYTYAWYVNSSLIAPTSSTLTGTYFSKGNTVYCRATPTDGTTTGTAVSSSTVTISNTAPVVSSVSLTPTTAYESSTLTCAPSASDADGDSISYTYAWYVNSSAVAATSSTLTGAYFSKNNTVYCRATPTDGSTAGTAVSSSTRTISNSTPSAPTVVITPDDPEAAADPLVCEIDTSATDGDGDSLTYTFTWTRNGASYTGASNTSTTSTVPAAATAADDVWTCSATASDGTASSSAGTDTIDVLGGSYTIGYASAFGTPGTGSTAANYSLCQSQVVSSSAEIYALGNYLRLADGDSMRLAVYTSAGGVPYTLVAYTALTPLSSYAAGSFVELDVVGAPVSISAGTYFICENLSGTAYLGYTTSGGAGNTIYYNSLSSGSAWPTPWGSGATFTGQLLNLYMIVR